MEVGVHDYNIADDSAKETTECKTLEKIVWDADHSNEFAERLEQLGVENMLTELLQQQQQQQKQKDCCRWNSRVY